MASIGERNPNKSLERMIAILKQEVPWYIYIVANHTKKQIYIGVVKDRGTKNNPAGPKVSVNDRFRLHCKGDTKALEHWMCDIDDLDLLCVFESDKQEYASEFAHKLERDMRLLKKQCRNISKCPGYEVIETSGT